MRPALSLVPNRKEVVVFLSGGYTSNKASPSVNWNLAIAQQCTLYLAERGLTVICPHTLYGFMGMEDKMQPHYEDIMKYCFHLIRRCDALYLAPLWQFSNGARRERALAEKIGLPIREIHWNDIFKENTEPVS